MQPNADSPVPCPLTAAPLPGLPAAPLRVIDFTFDRPALNLALDEVLLDSLETGRAGNTLWFWESPAPFAVLGVSQILADHADEAACAADGVTILRRCSAGGAVLQGPGCLNYSLVLAYDDCPDIKTIRASYCYILGRISAALQQRGVEARHQGISDLAVGDMKFSGNAQRRRRRGILHHGTLLYEYDLALLPKYLPEPVDRPEYRSDRDHARFVRNIPLSADTLREAVRDAFGAHDPHQGPLAEELDDAHRLVAEKYETLSWIRRR